jgi:hypothetical protein
MSEEENLIECSCCLNQFPEDEMTHADDDGTVRVCNRCYESDTEEPCATVYYHNDEWKDEELPYKIGHYRNETDGDFEVRYHRVDGWRGYYTLEPQDQKEWKEVLSDNIISGHASSEMLENINNEMIESFESAGVTFVRAFCRSSNVFCCGFDIYVKTKDFMVATMIMTSLKLKHDYNNPKWSKGLLVPENMFESFQEVLGKVGVTVKTDNDIMEAFEEDDDLLEKIAETLNT